MRNTRSVALTAEGERFRHRAQRILDELESAVNDVRDQVECAAAAAYTNSHKAEASALEAEYTKIPLATIEQEVQIVNATSLDAQQIQPAIDASVKGGLIKQTFPANEIMFSP
jgi:hypothetical protein